jgi:choline-sulfatase
VQLYSKLQALGLLESTLIIRTADHGEVGMSHGGLRQKNFNCYEESMRIPLVFSNPVLFPGPQTRDGLVSHVDLLPTIASLFQAPLRSNYPFAGRDYSAYLLDGAEPPPQDEIIFTFDDVRAGQNVAQVALPPNRIVAVREAQYKLALYYDVDAVQPDQWEMYDLGADPTELTNLYNLATGVVAAGYEADFERLQQKIYDAMAHRLAPLRVRATVDVQEFSGQVVVSWPGQEHISYQLQTSTDMTTWSDHGLPITGTESPQVIIPTTLAASPKLFVRVIASNWLPAVPA